MKRPTLFTRFGLEPAISTLILALAVLVGGSTPALASQVAAALGPAMSLHTPAAAWVAEGDGLLAFGRDDKVYLASIDDPSKVISTLTLAAPVTGGAVVGRYAYLAQQGLGLRVLDLLIPTQPADLGLIPREGSEFRVVQWSDYLLLASDRSVTILALGTRHSHVIDMAGGHCMAMLDPFALGEVSSIALNGDPVAIAASGTTAYVSTDQGPILAIDLTNKSAPKLVGTNDLAIPATALAAHMGRVAMGLAESSTAEAPSYGPLGPVIPGAQGLAAAGRSLFIAAGEKGLLLARDDSPAAATVSVSVGNFFFSPSSVSINEGDTVHWTWATGTHSATSGSCAGGNCAPDGKWDSGVRSSGTFDFTFPTAGTYPYYCQVHLASMTGKVIVKSVGPPPLAATSSATPTSGTLPLTVNFTGSASGGTAPYTYSWSFGDGSTASADQNPAHTYAQAGTYSAVLTVTDSTSATALAASIAITVSSTTVNPPVISAMSKKAPFSILVTGSNLQNGIQVSINGSPWANVLWKNTGKIKILGGKALKAVVPKGATTQFTFLNPDGGSAARSFTW